MTKTYKIYFTNGSDITIKAHHSNCKHMSNVNRDIINYCDENDTIIATFQMDKIIGDVLVKIEEDNEEKETKEVSSKNKRLKIVGFQLPEEDNNEKVKEKSKKSKTNKRRARKDRDDQQIQRDINLMEKMMNGRTWL